MEHPVPDISIVTAVYDVARYLPDFFDSLERQQGVDLSRVEIVAVDDGSTDDSLAVLHRYAADFAAHGILPMTVLTQANAGQGAARNHGMEHATGTWLTFTDPDDTLEPDYLAHVLRFVTDHPDTEMVATHRVFHDDATGAISDTHMLRRMFEPGDRLVDLDHTPDHFHGSAPAAFVRRDRLHTSGVRFDHRVRPNFEDGHFCTKYLLACDRPLVGFLRSAVYYYRKRSDGTSTLQNATLRPERYTHVPRYGYLDVLTAGAHRTARHGGTDGGTDGGTVPEWVQSYVLYEISWYFSAEDSPGGSATAATGEVAEQFLDLLAQIGALLDEDVVRSFRLRWLNPVWRQILLHGLSGEPWHSTTAVADVYDPEQQLLRVVHRFTGPEPTVEYLCDGTVTTPVHTKLRRHVYFDRTLLWERISWLPTPGSTVRLRLDGRPVEFRRWWAGALPTTLELDETLRRPTRPGQETRKGGAVRGVAVAAARRAAQSFAHSGPANRRFHDAWVLMDRIHDADDSGEHLFTWLRENRPDINAWFTVEAGTPDHDRLTAGPYADRVVAHGSRTWELLMLDCVHLVSSHVDVPVQRPPQIMKLLGTDVVPWRFTFLQHGVIKDDLSRWLNPKTIDVFVTSTAAEHASIAGDRTPYVLGTREVRLTGLPRFDRLRAAALSVRDDERDLLLVAPTWRQWLLPPLRAGSQRRTVRDDFLETEYARSWRALITSPELARVAADHGLRVGLLPHPNMTQALPLLGLPPHVELLSFEGGDAQRLFARAAVLVTDYSSMAFNAAYVDRPVVYFQFDAEAVMAGGHVGRAGYFRYERDGFGPVTQTVDRTVAEVHDIVARGCTPAPDYARRIEETFVLRDGRCCERVTAAIEALTRPSRGPSALPPAQRSASDLPYVGLPEAEQIREAHPA
ncbi:glycosyltransferase [Kineosporia sp. A_224]|uniref:bifunctional glycosyltransferase/CDP-glycerol:glycerophosphate glycerophosphotransferase n=1 Tax=Kineosporia sp. A_224 TaxID=1962180 RepID=UPI000B4B7130|nr:glycosyltransferase [Kineosporia sp. A_224]